jgi:hypothetical protein
MYSQSIAQVVVLMTTTLVSGIFVPGGLPDGRWHGIEFPNGTTITTSLSDPTIPPIIKQHEVLPRSIKERGSGTGGCWGYQLDPASVDADNQALQAYFYGTGLGVWFCSDSHKEYFGEILNSVMVYVCSNKDNECWAIPPAVIQQGIGLMDAICAPYEAG